METINNDPLHYGLCQRIFAVGRRQHTEWWTTAAPRTTLPPHDTDDDTRDGVGQCKTTVTLKAGARTMPAWKKIRERHNNQIGTGVSADNGNTQYGVVVDDKRAYRRKQERRR